MRRAFLWSDSHWDKKTGTGFIELGAKEQEHFSPCCPSICKVAKPRGLQVNPNLFSSSSSYSPPSLIPAIDNHRARGKAVKGVL